MKVVAPHPGREVLQPHLDKLLPTLVRRGYSVEFVGWDRGLRSPKRSNEGGVDYTLALRGGGYSTRRLAGR